MSKKLAAKASLIQLPPLAGEAAPAGATRRQQGGDARMKTAPGSMAAFMATQSAAVKEAESPLRERPEGLRRGAAGAHALTRRACARRAGRTGTSTRSSEAFAELKADIASAGTNVQPVSVRRRCRRC
jgi:ParB family chromosome partitioning protein